MKKDQLKVDSQLMYKYKHDNCPAVEEHEQSGIIF